MYLISTMKSEKLHRQTEQTTPFAKDLPFSRYDLKVLEIEHEIERLQRSPEYIKYRRTVKMAVKHKQPIRISDEERWEDLSERMESLKRQQMLWHELAKVAAKHATAASAISLETESRLSWLEKVSNLMLASFYDNGINTTEKRKQSSR
jgi:hypothetical protein